MGFAVLYEIDDNARNQLLSSESKLNWYKTMDRFGVGTDDFKKYDLEDSVGSLYEDLSCQPEPWDRLFAGEFRTELESGDPNVSFLGKQLVRDLAVALAASGDNFIDSVSPSRKPDLYAWLMIGLRSFFNDVAERDNAIVCLWEW